MVYDNKTEIYKKRFGLCLKNIIQENGLFLKDVAASLDVTVQYISKMTTGQHIPNNEQFDKIIETLYRCAPEESILTLCQLYGVAKSGIDIPLSSEHNGFPKSQKPNMNFASGVSGRAKKFGILFDQLPVSDQDDVILIMNNMILKNQDKIAKEYGIAEKPGEYTTPNTRKKRKNTD